MLFIALFTLFFSFYSHLYTSHKEITRYRAISQMTTRQLKEVLKANGHKGFSKLKKAELLEMCLGCI